MVYIREAHALDGKSPMGGGRHPLVEEPVSVITRPGHPLLAQPRLTLRDIVGRGWIVPPPGSVLRHRFELMFQEEGRI